MSSPEMISQLQKRKQELLKELQAIDILLAANQPAQAPAGNSPAPRPAASTQNHLGYFSTRDEHIAMLREKSDVVSWKDYTHSAVQILGPSRADAVSDLIIDANDHKIPDERVREAVNAALRTLVKEKKVELRYDENKEKLFYPA